MTSESIQSTAKLRKTTGSETPEEYIKVYGFCHWQAIEVARVRDEYKARVKKLETQEVAPSRAECIAAALDAAEEVMERMDCDGDTAQSTGVFHCIEAIRELQSEAR